MNAMKGIRNRLQRIHNLFRMSALAVFVLTLACERWIDPEYNIDPGAADDVPMSMLIPTIELDIGFNLMGMNTVQVTNIWMQYYTGVNLAWMQEITTYQPHNDISEVLWWVIYTKQLINAKILIEKAEQQQSPYNAAVGQILTAYSLGIATDLWGDIPYSNALKGTENVLSVPYDRQEQIYSSIDSLLDLAILNLSLDPAENRIDIEGDVYYEGNPDAWLKAAKAIKARHLLQLSNQRGEEAYRSALDFTDAFESNEDNMKCPFSITTQNPHYQDVQYSPSPVVMCSTFLDELDKTDDPRLAFYFGKDAEGNISAAPPGELNSDASVPGDYLAGVSGPLYLMTYSELQFIEAEAALMTGDPERADSAYRKAVEASLLQVTGQFDTLWLKRNIYIETPGSITLEKIIAQKRIALFGQVQAYSDWRRTGFPELVPFPGAQLPEIPKRYLYPRSEVSSNPGNVPYVTLSDPVWWADGNSR